MGSSRVPWRRSGHCFSFGPFELVIFLGLALLSVVVPVAVLARICVSLGRALLGSGPPEEAPDERLPIIRGPLVSAAELDIVAVTTEVDEARCPVCATSLAGEDVMTCPRCATPHHRDCWEFNGSCAVYGCRAAAHVAERSSATDSSLLSSSSSSPSLPDFMTLRRRFRRWFWLMRIQWWSLLLLACVGAAGFFLYGVGLGRIMMESIIVLGLQLMGAAFVLWLLAWAARYRLESSLERPPKIPPERLAVLLRRVEHSRSAPVIGQAVRWAPYVYAGLGVGLALQAMGDAGNLFSLVGSVVALLWGGAFLWMAQLATDRHRVALERVRARLRGAGKV